jgi:hypothetical protein
MRSTTPKELFRPSVAMSSHPAQQERRRVANGATIFTSIGENLALQFAQKKPASKFQHLPQIAVLGEQWEMQGAMRV